MNDCESCIHEDICRAWNEELKSVEESYSGQCYVTIYDRYIINGDGCELFKENVIPKYPKIVTDSFGEDADGRRGVKFNTVVCPTCDTELTFLAEQCSVCNQLIDWSEV